MEISISAIFSDTGFMTAFPHGVLKFQVVYLAQPDEVFFLWHGILRFGSV